MLLSKSQCDLYIFTFNRYPHNFEIGTNHNIDPYGSPIQPSLPILRLQPHNYTDKSTQTIEEKNDTSDLDELYRQLCKSCSPNTLKTFFSAMLLTQQNVDKKVREEFPENLEKMLTDL